MGIFKKKPKQDPLRKLILTTNKEGLGEYRCPYCNQLLSEGHPRLIEKPDIEFCPNCSKEFIK